MGACEDYTTGPFVRPSEGCCGQTATMICVRICHWTLTRRIGVTVAVISQAVLDRRAWGGSQIVVDYIACITLSTCLRGKRWQILFRASDEERPTRCSVRSIPSAYWDWWHRHRCYPGQMLTNPVRGFHPASLQMESSREPASEARAVTCRSRESAWLVE